MIVRLNDTDVLASFVWAFKDHDLNQTEAGEGVAGASQGSASRWQNQVYAIAFGVVLVLLLAG